MEPRNPGSDRHSKSNAGGMEKSGGGRALMRARWGAWGRWRDGREAWGTVRGGGSSGMSIYRLGNYPRTSALKL